MLMTHVHTPPAKHFACNAAQLSPSRINGTPTTNMNTRLNPLTSPRCDARHMLRLENSFHLTTSFLDGRVKGFGFGGHSRICHRGQVGPSPDIRPC